MMQNVKINSPNLPADFSSTWFSNKTHVNSWMTQSTPRYVKSWLSGKSISGNSSTRPGRCRIVAIGCRCGSTGGR